MRLAKTDFGLVLQKSCIFSFDFGFTKLTVVSVFWPLSTLGLDMWDDMKPAV